MIRTDEPTRPRSAEAPVCSVVIPCRNAESWLSTQLEALFRQEDAPRFEILVVDNGSTDGTRVVAQAAHGPIPVRVVDASEEAGLSHARNAGVAAASAEQVLFCDADDLVAPGWVAALHRAFEETDFQWRAMEHGSTMVTTSAASVAYRLRGTWRGIFRQQRRYQLNRVLLWVRFRDRGMTGPSAKHSLVAVLRALLDTARPGSDAGARLDAAYRLGGHLGALQGILRYRVLRRVPPRRLMGEPAA